MNLYNTEQTKFVVRYLCEGEADVDVRDVVQRAMVCGERRPGVVL